MTKPECEYFGQVAKVHVGKVSANVKSLTHKLTIDQADEFQKCLAAAVAHERQAERQKKSRKPRSNIKSINTILITTHRTSGQMTIIGKNLKKRKQV